MAGKSPEEVHPVKAYGWAARDTSGILSPFKFSRRATGADDVRIKILYCAICHTDFQFARNEFGFLSYPIVPGMEIVGVATEVGSNVTKFKVGDKVAAGGVVGTCGKCEDCLNGLENYCPKLIITYGVPYHDGTINFGGFSNEIVITERFLVRFPDKLPLAAGTPLIGVGITGYSAMRYNGLDKPGLDLGVVGLGGLGHLVVKFAKAFGMKVTVISTSASKKDEAINKLGADAFLHSRDDKQMKACNGTFDGIIDTAAVVHPIEPLIDLLKSHGKLVMLGSPPAPIEFPRFPIGRKQIVGSAAGSAKETQEMFDFAAEHNITADVEVIPMDYVNTAMERLERGDVKYRFVIDIENTLVPPE